MTTYMIAANGIEYLIKVEYPLIVEADKPLAKFIGEKLLTLINVCALKNYSIEKL